MRDLALMASSLCSYFSKLYWPQVRVYTVVVHGGWERVAGTGEEFPGVASGCPALVCPGIGVLVPTLTTNNSSATSSPH